MQSLRRLFRKLPPTAPPTPQEMIAVLLDRTVEFGDRDDLAMDLGQFDNPEIEAALLSIASDFTEDEDIADTAGQSLSEIWKRQGRVPAPELVAQMQPSARKFFQANDV